MESKILYRDQHLVVFFKDSGLHIHPPEDKQIRVHRSKIILYQLRDFLGQRVFPVHRLDVATSGVMLMALNSEMAAQLCRQFQSQTVQKKYLAVIRGFVKEYDTIEKELELDSTKQLVAAKTSYQRIATVELDYAVTPKYPKSRYSLIKAQPHTGRYHQIRRHFNRISHPIIGDAYHGDSHHNRFFRETLNIRGLCLKAQCLSFTHPVTEQILNFEAPNEDKWLKIYSLFSVNSNPDGVISF
jgi:tRNA pseudouridine65 synthase